MVKKPTCAPTSQKVIPGCRSRTIVSWTARSCNPDQRNFSVFGSISSRTPLAPPDRTTIQVGSLGTSRLTSGRTARATGESVRKSFATGPGTRLISETIRSGNACRCGHGQLVVDPPVGALEPVLERNRRLPAEQLADERVVAVPAADALGLGQVVPPLELDAGDLLDDVDEAVDRDQLGAADVDRLGDVALHQHAR